MKNERFNEIEQMDEAQYRNLSEEEREEYREEANRRELQEAMDNFNDAIHWTFVVEKMFGLTESQKNEIHSLLHKNEHIARFVYDMCNWYAIRERTKLFARDNQFMYVVREMRFAQKEANDMIAQAECYQEATEYIKKAEELESKVDKWLEERL